MAPRSSLTPDRQRLVDLCSQLGFGRIERLQVRDRNPVFGDGVAIVTERKLGADAIRPDRPADFCLKPAVIDLLRVLDLVGNGQIRCLEVRHGLPFRLEIEGMLAA